MKTVSGGRCTFWTPGYSSLSSRYQLKGPTGEHRSKGYVPHTYPYIARRVLGVGTGQAVHVTGLAGRRWAILTTGRPGKAIPWKRTAVGKWFWLSIIAHGAVAGKVGTSFCAPAEKRAVRQMGAGVEEIDLELGPGEDDGTAAAAASPPPSPPQFTADAHRHHHHPLIQQQQQQGINKQPNPRKKKKVVKKWRDEWAETYKWAYVAASEGGTTHRIFCSVCKEYGRKHRRNPYGNEGSRNMQMSALEEHNNSLLHKEALRLQMASKDKTLGLIDRPSFIKGANMPCTSEAIEVFRQSKIVFGPGKAANAGGVAIQGLEMLQNTHRVQWTPEDVDNKLQETMKDIYQKSLKAANDFGIVKSNPEALVHGANIAGFLQVAQAMLEQGCV
ncbi:unnamed protein product [Sphagnum jensenii]